VALRLDDRRRTGAPETDGHVGVREIIARATLTESDGTRGVALIEIELCLDDGSRVHARSEDRLRLVIDLSNGLSERAAVNAAVRTHVREALSNGSAAGWPAFRSLARYGATWHPEQDEARVSVGV
jgi:hypothetical protein